MRPAVPHSPCPNLQCAVSAAQSVLAKSIPGPRGLPLEATNLLGVSGKRLELKVPPLVWALTCALLMKGCSVWLPSYSLDLPFAGLFAPLLVGLGMSFVAAGVFAIRQASSTIDPRHPERTSSVVDSGIYGVTRNPIYVGMTMALCGWAVHLQNVPAFLLLVAFVATVTQVQIRPEERALEDRFGESYVDYRRRVPRWLFRLSEEDFQL